jgi:hypothetical protein
MKHARLDYQQAIVDLRDPEFQKDFAERLLSELAGRLEAATSIDGAVGNALRATFHSFSHGDPGIPTDEPVFLLRAQDQAAPATVEDYAELARQLGSSELLVEACLGQAMAMAMWQENVKAKVADLPIEEAEATP